ncbi:MAG: sugar phosphate isomerase/epimerase [Clostridia bacterium]|nr:sugar phosphate isomerase/epimerase [Clostridia bacterium]
MSKIKIYAFSDEASPWVDQQIAALLRNGLGGMEIRNVDGVNVADITREKAKEVKEKMDAHGLCVWSIGSPIGKITLQEDFEKHLEKFRHTLEIASILNAKNLRLFSFFLPKNSDPRAYKEQVFARLGQLVEAAKGYDITLCHENEKGIYGDVPERCLEIHRQFPPIKAVFDPANFVQCGVDTLKAWALLKDHVHYMHIKDALEDGFVVPSGKGVGNVQQIAKDFIARGGKEFTVEPHLKVFDGFDKLEHGEGFKAHCEFASNEIAFDAGCQSFKELLK